MSKRSVVSALRWSCAGLAVFLAGCNMEVLSPKGDVGMHEKNLILIALGLMSVVVIPVIALTLWFAWRYRASNTKATYAPKWSHSTKIETVMWGIPCVIIAILAVITWRSTHQLDPYKPLVSDVKPVTIEAVAMDWKWLFIYPDYGVASVNQIAFPVDTPVNFKITSASVMNAFFIPQLGSQIYAMNGMQTKLHLIAREAGDYDGLSSNYSGAGFSDMRFKAIATSQQGFQAWLAKAKASSAALDLPAYQALEQPSEKVPVSYYATVAPDLFEDILHKDLGGKPAGAGPSQGAPMKGMSMQGMPAHDGVAAIPSHNDHAKAAE